MNHSLKEIVEKIKPARNILIATHAYPDADALGSQLGLGIALEGSGKKVFLYIEEALSYLYDFMPGSEKLQTVLPDLKDFDCAIALDCGDCFRLGQQSEKLLTIHPFLVIDHHTGHKEFGDFRWVDENRAATGEMIYDLLTELGVEISSETAYCLYAAIVSDTGSFKYSSTTADTFRVTRELVARGAPPAKVAGKLFDNFTVSRLQLLKNVLDTLALYGDNQIATITVTRKMFAETGASEEDTETFINYPRSLSSVRIAAFFKEAKDGKISVSLRSKGKHLDVAMVARHFGGGGHRNAAGFKMAGMTIEQVREQLMQQLLPMVTV